MRRTQGLISWFLLIYLVQILFVAQVSTQCLDDQRFLLMQLKISLVYDRTSSSKLVTWNQSADCCKWDGVDCDGAGRVVSLNLENETISGGIESSTALFKFQYLENLNLAFNFFSSAQIPNRIQNLTKLSYLNLSNAGFGGQVPVEISTLRSLVILDLSHNSLTGSLSSKHFEGLSNLVFINLGFNLLNGSISGSLFGLPSLQGLHLSNNKFSGQIDEFPIPSPSNLDTVDLSSNRLNGSLPESFFKLERLSVLSLSWNLFSGTLKLEKFQRFPNLTRLELAYNNLSVDTSNSSFFRLPKLSRLNLASCNLYHFPNLRKESNLAFLDLSSNHIGGEIPSWIWTVGDGSLLHLNLSFNLFVGLQKPVNVSPSLSILDVNSNRLQDELPVPPESAVYVDYSSNNFQGPIPANVLSPTSSLVFFSLANNSLSGTIPASLCNAIYLQVLDLSYNYLSGRIPPCLLENVTISIGVLNLRRNNIEGNIPDAFSINCSLKTLDLSNNNLEGKIPSSMANCKSLELLNIGNNNLDGTFPCWLKSCSSLRVLVLRNNNLYGDISCSEVDESWPVLDMIDIAYNNLGGELNPQSITSWKGMILDDGRESRGDHIRFEFLSNVYYRDAVMVTIKGLELEVVQFLTVFTAIDFSCNNFSGDIPHTVGDLSSLYVLNLSHNSFSGSIPSSIGNLTQLGSLDLSDNLLTGRIPQELTNLNFLFFLNLSYNMLVGMIPKGSQFQTFSAGSFEGNSGLCGFPSNMSCASDSMEGNSTASLKKREYDWQLIITGLACGFVLHCASSGRNTTASYSINSYSSCFTVKDSPTHVVEEEYEEEDVDWIEG